MSQAGSNRKSAGGRRNIVCHRTNGNMFCCVGAVRFGHCIEAQDERAPKQQLRVMFRSHLTLPTLVEQLDQ